MTNHQQNIIDTLENMAASEDNIGRYREIKNYIALTIARFEAAPKEKTLAELYLARPGVR